MLSLLPQCLQTPSRLSHLLNVNLLSLEQDASGRTARSGVPLRDARSLCYPYQSLLLTCGQKNTHSRVWQCSTCSSLQQGADLGPAAVAAEVFLLHWVSVFFHSLIESLFGGSHVVASSQCMFSLSVTVQALDYYVEKRSMCNDNQQQEQCESFFGSWHSSECYFGTRADLFRGMTKHTLPQQKCCTTLAAASPSKLLQNY